MEDYIYLIRTYLPVEFREPDTNEFMLYLIDAYAENLSNQKYQFSFMSFHMLYMSYVYKIKWFLKQQGDSAIDDSIQEFIRQNRGATFNTLFDLSQFAEKTSLEKLLKSLSFHVNDVDLCKNLVEVRNKCSHASGKIYFKRPQQVENYIQEELDSVIAIQSKIKPYLIRLLEGFIKDTWNNSWIEADIKEWISNNYLSQKDLEELLKYQPDFLQANSNTSEIVLKKILFVSITSEFVRLVNERGDYFIKSLKALMKGIVSQIDIRRNPADSEKLKSTQEIIDERIVPILTDIPTEESEQAQTILQLSEAN